MRWMQISSGERVDYGKLNMIKRQGLSPSPWICGSSVLLWPTEYVGSDNNPLFSFTPLLLDTCCENPATHTLRKSQQPHGQTHMRNNQGPRLTPSAHHQLARHVAEWSWSENAILVKLPQLMSQGVKVRCSKWVFPELKICKQIIKAIV